MLPVLLFAGQGFYAGSRTKLALVPWARIDVTGSNEEGDFGKDSVGRCDDHSNSWSIRN